jgi:hypothetical protein
VPRRSDLTNLADNAQAVSQVTRLYQVFVVQELEEDPDMRKHVALYKNEAVDVVAAADDANEMEEDDDTAAHELEIPLEDLLDDLEGLAVEEEP